MNREPRVLIASVSLHERLMVQSLLKEAGFTTVDVDDAEGAAREISANAPGVLVIDAGLLEAPHDAQWRQLRLRHPGLATAVRCLTPRGNGSRRLDRNTLLVHPDDGDGLREAIAVLAAAPSPRP